MQLLKQQPPVWMQTTDDAYNAIRAGGYPDFLAPAQKSRLERVRQARMLFDARHREYFLQEGRTQFDFPFVRVGQATRQLYLTYNVLGLISLKSADLLFGESPILRADDDQQQEALTKLDERCGLHSLFAGCAADSSAEGECFLEAVVQDGQVYLQQVPAETMFPVGPLRPNGQHKAYVRYDLHNRGTDEAPIWLLLETTYAAGSIRRNLWQLDNGKKVRELSLDQWPAEEGSAPLAPVTVTGITANTITWIPNLLVRGCPMSDYDGAIELQDSLNAKNSQVARVLLKHSDPKLGMPQAMADPAGNARSDNDVFFFNSKEDIPQYITWNAELDAAMKDRAFTLNQLLVRTETSPVLLGLKEGAAPDAYKKVRLESFNSLTKAGRKAAYWKAGIRRALAAAQQLEQIVPGPGYAVGPIAVQLRDGIPIDDKERAETLANLRGAGLISVQRALEEQLQDPAAIDKERAELLAEAAAQQPPVTMQAIPADPAAEPGTAGGVIDPTQNGRAA